MTKPIKVHIDFGDDYFQSFESSLVTPMGPGIYRLEESPLFSEVASFGDVIEAEQDDEGRLYFRRLVSKSGFRVYRWLVSQQIYESKEFADFYDTVMQIGGMWERALGGIVIVHIPADSNFDLKQNLPR